MRPPVLWMTLLVTAAAVTSALPARAELSPRILGGRPAPAAEATVALRDGAGRLICSGVLVGPRAVLTAAHCLPLPAAFTGGEPDETPGPSDVCFGARVDACTSVARVSGFALHPEWDPLTFHGDLAVVALASEAPVTPAELGERIVAPGTALEIVGFGRTTPDAPTSAGERRVTTTRVNEIEDGRAVHGEAACNGDSGGPLFLADDPTEVAAITSSGPTGCRDFGRATLVGPHAAWIRDRVRASAPEPESASCAVRRGGPRDPGSGASLGLLAVLAVGGRLRRRGRPPGKSSSAVTRSRAAADRSPP